MKKDLTELVFILDKSGSMADMVEDTVGGFNAMIEKQKKLDGEVLVSTVLFSNNSKVLHDRVPIEKIEPLNEDQYHVGGGTALIDAIGSAVSHIGNIHKYAREEDRPEHTLFVITTDGMENSSRIFGSEQVKQMIKRQKELYGWEFIFAAADIEAVETARNIGINPDRAAMYARTKAGTRALYDAVDSAVECLRRSSDIGADWLSKLNK